MAQITLPCLSMKQPWANMLVSGVKTIETRTWPTRHRGWLLIAASLKVDESAMQLRPHAGFGRGPRGRLVGLVKITGCRPMTEHDEQSACCAVYPRAQAWLCADATLLPSSEQHRIKGRLGIFSVKVPLTPTIEGRVVQGL